MVVEGFELTLCSSVHTRLSGALSYISSADDTTLGKGGFFTEKKWRVI